jgi:chorismate synthase
MSSLRILMAGESHGKQLTGIIQGLPAGLKLDKNKINLQLHRRQLGCGRGARMQIEKDKIEIVSGVRFSETLGSPISLCIQNRDWENWKDRMGIWSGKTNDPIEIPRPGHADLAGCLKYGQKDIRNIIERASARETAMRVAIGSIIRQLLEIFDIWIGSHVIQIYSARNTSTFQFLSEHANTDTFSIIQMLCERAELSDVRCSDSKIGSAMKRHILNAEERGNTVGGVFELSALNVPVGLGSHISWDLRLDTQIAGYIMSIPGIKAVEIGLGTECASRLGSKVHDPIIPGDNGIPIRHSNRAGGIEGGISNGQPILVRATMKPIPTLTNALPSVRISSGQPATAHKERSDICAVPAASIVGEAMLSIALGTAFCEKFGGDSLDEMKKHYNADHKN